ncbi:FAD-binding oxidoreductase [Pedobacter changchengzhani]|uniref:FAD-binding oxidoreductase n=1 Tax=Pedobacter changchengzhani TaxID=2529274 RepID=A0A4R5MLD7_9SPHI|nr:PepSY domain-containing protein [Pedobacter changchengzhani]TDG36504.1 FAD-binding oxidoreductase [Pedobacter changchengzhani]
MTISIWRYSHLALAVSSFLFITLASLTGIVLSFKPVADKMQPYKSENFNNLTVAQLIPNVTKNFTDVIEVHIDENKFVVIDATDLKDQSGKFYIDPNSGKVLGKVAKESEFFQWVTALHRSLFLHQLGRFFIGLSSFLLFLIATSGTVLIIQRQRSIKRFFAKIVKDNFAQYYHVVLGRLLLIPIIIISVSGVILSFQTFELFPAQKGSPKINLDLLKISPKTDLKDFAIFSNTKLSDVQSIEFPFSNDVEDYFTVKLKDKEITVNQLTGDVLSTQFLSKTKQLVNLSMDLHTGKTSAIWAVVLGIASVNILFFIYSGFAIWWKRRQVKIKNKYKASEAEFILLVGSENGTTFHFAKAIYHQLLKSEKAVYIGQLNDYMVFPKAKQLVVFTATYGIGEAPTNASKFIDLLKRSQQKQPVAFSVVGFGSHGYPDFCKFGYEVNNVLSQQNWAEPLVEIHCVNDRSPGDFTKWATLWAQNSDILLDNLTESLKVKPVKTQIFDVIEKKISVQEEPSFLIKLRPRKNTKFRSGDLLTIFPANDYRERQYSIGKIGNDLQLSVKLHQNGLGSGFLRQLEIGQAINATLVNNKHFHFPLKAKKVIMVSNGTGIAPFLGMIDEYGSEKEIHLYCGFRDENSFNLYESILNTELQKVKKINIAYSRSHQKQYVKDLLFKDADFIHTILKNGGVIMLCGSLNMQKDVIDWLEIVCEQKAGKSVSYYQARGKLLMDCY